MKKILRILSITIITIFISSALVADWNVGDPHKMGGVGPQLPDPTGYDVNFAVDYIGDDFECGESGEIDQIHFWISFSLDTSGTKAISDVGSIFLQIYSDDPIGDNGIPGEDIDNTYSKPLNILWEGFGDWTRFMTDAIDGIQDWYDPWEPYTIDDNHTYYYQINLTNITGMVIVEDPNNLMADNPQPYYQTAGTIYWLLIHIDQTTLEPDGEPIGWKTSQYQWNDDAVFYDVYDVDEDPTEIWIPLNQHPWLGTPLHAPYDTHIDLAFVISGSGATLPVSLSQFVSAYLNSQAQLYWTTQSELDNLCWNIYRGENNNFTSAQKINDEFIPGHGTTTEPNYYTYHDPYGDFSAGSTYYYWLESIDMSGSVHHYDMVASMTIPHTDPGSELIEVPILHQLISRPNPMHYSTEFIFTLDKNAVSHIDIYNLKGELVKALPEVYASENVDMHVYWNGNDSQGKRVSPGIYIYRLNANDKTIDAQKLIILK